MVLTNMEEIVGVEKGKRIERCTESNTLQVK